MLAPEAGYIIINESMRVINNIIDMREAVDQLRKNGSRICYVPTMGALHKGHEALMEAAMNNLKPESSSYKIKSASNLKTKSMVQNDKRSVIVSIFVNPKQFNNASDLNNYPKTLEQDLESCRKQAVECVFVPSTEEIYPNGLNFEDDCMIEPPEYMTNHLEGKSRPGHFKGMLTIVCKLFNIIQPDEAYFGEKDYQQFILVNKMVDDLNLRVDVRPVPTVRDPDWLPLSSRNVRLGTEARQIAPVMSELLFELKYDLETNNRQLDSVLSDDSDTVSVNQSISELINSGLETKLNLEERKIFIIDYAELRCSRDLSELNYSKHNKIFDCERQCWTKHRSKDSRSPNSDNRILDCRLLMSVIVDGIRLLDNVGLRLKQP